MNDKDVVILAARRSPLGAFQGQFASLSAPALGGNAIRAVVEDAGNVTRVATSFEGFVAGLVREE